MASPPSEFDLPTLPPAYFSARQLTAAVPPRSLKTNRWSLARRVPTRWNSDFECLLSLLELGVCAEALIRDSPGELGGLKFSDDQWLLTEQIVRVLKSGVPLVHEAVPMFIRMRRKLEQVGDNKPGNLEPIIRVAAHYSLLVFDKYMGLFKESEFYWITLVMYPNYKLKWLHDNGFTDTDVSAVRDPGVRRFISIFTTGTVLHSKTNLTNSVGADLPVESDDEWDLGDSSNAGTACVFDSTEDYLSTEPVSPLIVKSAGGTIQHWQSQLEPTARLRLAQFALNYLSAPASDVPDTFCAKMALRSWYGTPLMDGVGEVAALLEGKEHASLD